MSDLDNAILRATDSLARIFKRCARKDMHVVGRLVTSPIEVMLSIGIKGLWVMRPATPRAVLDCGCVFLDEHSEVSEHPGLMTVTPQFGCGKFRVDFAITHPIMIGMLFVECDGHDFHEKTKEQDARDKARDRFLQATAPVLRFTGSEVWADPAGCAEQIADFIEQMAIRQANERSDGKPTAERPR